MQHYSEQVPHFSASQLNQPTANRVFSYLYLKERRKDTKVGFNAAVGTACHNAIQSVLCLGEDVDTAIVKAVADLDFHTAPPSEPEDKRDKYKEILPDMITNGLNLLGEAFGGSKDEQRVEVLLDGIDVPIIGYIDLCSSSSFCEIKTKAIRRGAVKKDGSRGYSRASIPAQPEYNHMCQIAIYHKATGLVPTVAYIADHDAVLFTPDNCEELQPHVIAYYLEEVRQKALRWQNLLKISTDPAVLVGFVEPDFTSFYWDEETLEEAKNLWKI